MGRVTEYVGAEGVISSELDHARLSRPRSGDVVRWPDGTLGRVWQVGSGYCDPGQVYVCCELGSAFLFGDGTVDISGGPFEMVALDALEATFELRAAVFWNWGDRVPGAGQGVEYVLARPVFAIRAHEESGVR
jgi:hypothetical protein